MLRNTLFLVFCFFIVQSTFSQELLINEVLSSNETSFADGTGDYEDWVEIRNQGLTAVNISGYYISDDFEEITKYQLPNSSLLNIPAGDYIILWASGNISKGDDHLDFKLSSSGEGIILTMGDGVTLIDSVSFPALDTDISYGRDLNTLEWLYFSPSSPDDENDSNDSFQGKLSASVYSHLGGFYSNPFNLSISSEDLNASIYYTLDGSEPDPNNLSGTTYAYKNTYPCCAKQDSFKTFSYSSSIIIDDRSNQPNRTSIKGTTYEYYPSYFPEDEVKKAVVVKSKVFKTGYLPSETVTHSYFISDSLKHTLPVVSFSSNEESLFGYFNGIYTAGGYFETYTPDGNGNYCSFGNYSLKGSGAERLGNIEIFKDFKNVLNIPVDYRIHGGCSRSAPRKTLRLYAKEEIEEDLFEQGGHSVGDKRLLLRNSGNDWNSTLFRDAFYHDLIKDLSIGTQLSLPSIVYVNGEYWGFQNLRERMDRYYLSGNFNVDPDDLDLIDVGKEEAEEGSVTDFDDFNDFIQQNDFDTKVMFDSLGKRMDIEGYMDYIIAETFANNLDWPQNNQRMWKSNYTDTTEVFADERWRWLFYDIDVGLGLWGSHSDKDLERAVSSGSKTRILRRLLEYPEFETNFINRYADLLNTTFKSEWSTNMLDDWKQILEPEIDEHIRRWNYPESREEWEDEVDDIFYFLENRNAEIRTQVNQIFGLNGTYDLTVSVSDTAAGELILNSISLNHLTHGVSGSVFPWVGKYFNNVEIVLSAKANLGYKFDYWLQDGVAVYSDSLTISPNSNTNIVAVYKEYLLSENPIPSAFIGLNCEYRFTEWDENTPASEFPSSMRFVYMNELEPGLLAVPSGFTSGVYDEGSRTRVVGQGSFGVSFINTGNLEGNLGYPGNKLGGAVIALNTEGLDSVRLSWTARTIKSNNRQYGIRLKYRIGDQLLFQNLRDSNDSIIDYERSEVSGDSERFEDIELPNELLGQEYIQLFWQYYYVGPVESGSRDELGIDDIEIVGIVHLDESSNRTEVSRPAYIYSTQQVGTILPHSNLSTRSIQLLPGFQSELGSLFLAEISPCLNYN